jgi:FAD:protein FMN transferase
MSLVRLSSVSKSYGSRSVVRDLSFALEEASATALVGHNGAGKTTIMKMMRVIRIAAASAGMAILPFSATGRGDEHLHVWRGTALGAVATLELHHPDAAAAAALIDRVAAEVRRLERIFSLYKSDSDVCRLNRTGFIEAPPVELVDLLRRTRLFHDITGGAFDVSVQPLWSLYFDHFARPAPDPAGPSEAQTQAALAHVGLSRVRVDADRIAIPKGMALTLNGIAQGYITDAMVGLLRRAGVAHTLVDMGETRVIGAKANGEPWRVGVADPADPERTCARIDLVDRAVATSGGYGFQFDAAGRFNHLFDPRTGRCAGLYRSISVVADDATTADALSTAFSLLLMEEFQTILRRSGAHSALAVGHHGVVRIDA